MKQKSYIAASILSANFAHLGDEVRAVIQAGVDWIHFDVMDQHYVPNLTFGPMICESLRQDGIDAFIDVHLMVEPVEDLILAFAKAGANSISFHPDAVYHVDRCLSLIHDQGCQAGIVLNPAMSLDYLDFMIDKIDLILLMSVNPGFGGQSFIPLTLEKIKRTRKIIDQLAYNIRLQVDGGITNENIKEIAQSGADTFVVGSHLFHNKDYQKTVEHLHKNINK